MSTPCAVCAGHGTSCCNGYQIFLTPGDVSRIATFLREIDFFTLEAPISEEIAPDYDPSWLTKIMSPDNRVRVLKRNGGKRCRFVSETGCLLPKDRRPLICRLYPYTFVETGLLGIDAGCPISKNRDWPAVLDGMGMSVTQARRWIRLLYKEMKAPLAWDFRAAG